MLISVVICAYNAADTLARALTSALNQDIPLEDYEVLLIDDGSTDQTPDIAGQFGKRHQNLRYVRFPINKGLVAACNYGLNACLGEYFIRLDADDEFDSRILSSCVEPLRSGGTDFVYCDRYEAELDGSQKTVVQVEQFNPFELIAIGTMLRTDLVKKAGGFRDLFWEEYDLYMRYLQQTDKAPVRIPEPLYSYTKHSASMTANPENVQAGWQELRDLWGDELLRGFGWRGPQQEAMLS